MQIQITEPCTVDIAADGQRHEASLEVGTFDPGAEDLDPSVRAALLHLVANGLATVVEEQPGEVAELERTAGTPIPAGAVEEVSQVGDSQ